MPSRSGKVVAIIPAAGVGVRMKTSTPKQYLELKNKPLLIHTLEKFQLCQSIDEIILVVPKHTLRETEQLVIKWKIEKLLCVIPGGEERQDSVREGLNNLPEKTQIVVIHDGIRPFISIHKIQEAVEAAAKHGASVLALPVKETIKERKGHWVKNTLDREPLLNVQTPQCFLKQWIRDAHTRAEKDNFYATDDSALVERIGHPVFIVQGEEKNVKITSPSDLKLAEWLLQEENI